jgi:hypothetical protein
MGNRSLRKEVAKLIKENGGASPHKEWRGSKKMNKLYYGSKRAAWKYYNAMELRILIRKLSMKPGDLFNDCDGFNHRVIKPLSYYYPRDNNLICFYLEQFEVETGGWSCSCPNNPAPPMTINEIEKFHRGQLCDDEIYQSLKEDGWISPRDEALRNKLLNNERICDDDGLPIV